jgi:hypothetical protein
MVALDRPGTLGLLEREAEIAELRAVLDGLLPESKPAAASKRFVLLPPRRRLGVGHSL